MINISFMTFKVVTFLLSCLEIYLCFLYNAIEASEKLPKEKRWLKIRTRKKNQMWIFQVSNSIRQAPNVRNGKLRSLKKSGIHGWGMDNIHEIIDKYERYLTYKYDNKKFELNLYLCF